MPTLNNRLQLALLNRRNSKNVLEKGFTLVELMIVIVIVGILSAVALPNFLSQTERAKSTEASSKLSALLKEAHAEYQLAGSEASAVADISESITAANNGSIFTYALTGTDSDGYIEGSATANAAGSSNADASIAGNIIYGCVSVTTGQVDMSSRFTTSGTNNTSCS